MEIFNLLVIYLLTSGCQSDFFVNDVQPYLHRVHPPKEITLASLLDSISAENELILKNGYDPTMRTDKASIIDGLCKDGSLHLNSPETFRINQKSDTVIVMIHENNYVYIWSRTDSLYLRKNAVGKYEESFGFSPKFYEKDLLVEGNIDSIMTLCQYDFYTDYDCIPENYVYRFLIKNHHFTTEYHYYEGVPQTPDNFASVEELLRREKFRNELKTNSPELYNSLFAKKKSSPEKKAINFLDRACSLILNGIKKTTCSPVKVTSAGYTNRHINHAP
ncbi:MAG: hypothetical protein K2L14_00550 [Duncaniella sp.]|nr:hypothetical protein [Duncaniella sp.]